MASPDDVQKITQKWLQEIHAGDATDPPLGFLKWLEDIGRQCIRGQKDIFPRLYTPSRALKAQGRIYVWVWGARVIHECQQAWQACIDCLQRCCPMLLASVWPVRLVRRGSGCARGRCSAKDILFGQGRTWSAAFSARPSQLTQRGGLRCQWWSRIAVMTYWWMSMVKGQRKMWSASARPSQLVQRDGLSWSVMAVLKLALIGFFI